MLLWSKIKLFFVLGVVGLALLVPDHAASKFAGGAFGNFARVYSGVILDDK